MIDRFVSVSVNQIMNSSRPVSKSHAQIGMDPKAVEYHPNQ
jgi:hypothetical protein